MFDGIKEYKVPNERGLKTFKKLIKKNYVKESQAAKGQDNYACNAVNPPKILKLSYCCA